MTEKKEFQVNKNTPFWDASLTDQERIDWLLKEMTVEEKLGYLASSSPDHRPAFPGYKHRPFFRSAQDPLRNLLRFFPISDRAQDQRSEPIC